MTKEEKFKSIFRQYYTPLCNYAHTYLNNWDKSKDIVQSTFLKIWNNWDTFSGAESQKSYLFRAVKNTLIDTIRKEKRMGISEDGHSSLLASNETELDSLAIRAEIMKSLNKLKTKNRKIFMLNKIEGLTYPEIAKFLKISERSVEDNMARAFKALRKDLANNKNIY